MTSAFDNLVGVGKPLKVGPPNEMEFTSLVRSGQLRLADAQIAGLSLESQFDLAYNGVHALCLAALRWHGYRSSNRYIVFQLLPHTLGLGPEVWRVFAKCHEIRNLAEYEGTLNLDERILTDLMRASDTVSVVVAELPPIGERE